MVTDKCPNGLIGLIGLNPNGLIGLIGLIDPIGLNYSLIKPYSAQMRARLMIVFIAFCIVVNDAYS